MSSSFTLDGDPLPYGPFTVGDVNYPATVLDLWSDEELAEIGVARIPAPPPTPEDLEAARLADLAAQARSALAASDVTVLRCLEAGQPVPEDWIAYREALRLIVGGGPGPLPARPDYPSA